MKINRFMKAELVALVCTLVLGAVCGPEKGFLHTTADNIKQAIKMPSDTDDTHGLCASTFYGSNAMAGLGKLREL
jgi:hypothetical protein